MLPERIFICNKTHSSATKNRACNISTVRQSRYLFFFLSACGDYKGCENWITLPKVIQCDTIRSCEVTPSLLRLLFSSCMLQRFSCTFCPWKRYWYVLQLMLWFYTFSENSSVIFCNYMPFSKSECFLSRLMSYSGFITDVECWERVVLKHADKGTNSKQKTTWTPCTYLTLFPTQFYPHIALCGNPLHYQKEFNLQVDIPIVMLVHWHTWII